MKAIDGFLDLRMSDTRMDFKSALFGNGETAEYRALREQFLLDKSQRENMGVTSSLLSMICPIMPLGLLSVFQMLGRMDGLDEGPQMAIRQQGLMSEMARIAAADALMRKRKKEGIEDDGYLQFATRQMELRPLRMAFSTHRIIDKQTLPKRRGLEQPENGYFMTKKETAKASKVRKEKILLESMMKKESEEQKFSEASSISSKIEALDKLLKRIEA